MVLKALKSAPARLIVGAIRVYRFVLSPFLGQACRFTPSCSHYMEQAVLTHGATRGGILGLVRICKCHPYYKGDWVDTVPQVLPSWLDFGTTAQRCRCIKVKKDT
ncbi:MAG: membrane protein insertion efficiency factor YidD [Pseudomonadota bacterium]